MSLDTPWQIEQTWGSNQPVLKGITEILKPKFGIECGCGFFSTPILCENVGNLLTVEHDRNWVKKVQMKYPPTSDHQYTIQTLEGASNGASHEKIGKDTFKVIDAFYSGIIKPYRYINFLLIDTFRCARVPAAKILAPIAEVVVIHDVRPCSREYYQYNRLDKMFEDWIRYEHRPKGMINKKHIIPWTAVYSREPLELDKINPIIKKDSKRLWDQSVGLEIIDGS